MALADRLAQWSERPGRADLHLSVTPAHRAVAAEIRDLMRQAGMHRRDRCDRQCRRASRRRRSARAKALILGVALRHGPQRRKIRRPARRPDRAGRGRASAAARPQAAVSSRRDRILRRRGRALRFELSRQQRGRGALRSEPARAARRRGRHLGGGDGRGGAGSRRHSRAGAAPARSSLAISRSISSRVRCCWRRTCRSGS